MHKVAPQRHVQWDNIDRLPKYLNTDSVNSPFSSWGTSEQEEAILSISKE